LKAKLQLLQAKLLALLKKVILLEDYNHGGMVISERENYQRAAIHFLWPFCLSILAGHYFGNVGRIVFAVVWVVHVIRKEVRESKWQSALKSRSDIVTKLAGLLGCFI